MNDKKINNELIRNKGQDGKSAQPYRKHTNTSHKGRQPPKPERSQISKFL